MSNFSLRSNLELASQALVVASRLADSRQGRLDQPHRINSLVSSMKTEPHRMVRTGLGELSFRLLDGRRRAAITAHSIHIFSIQPTIPTGMSVRACTVALLTLTAKCTEKNMIFSCSWEPPFEVRGGAESGERLDAQSWQNGGTIVFIGTEDYEALSARLPDCGFSENDYPVR